MPTTSRRSQILSHRLATNLQHHPEFHDLSCLVMGHNPAFAFTSKERAVCKSRLALSNCVENVLEMLIYFHGDSAFSLIFALL